MSKFHRSLRKKTALLTLAAMLVLCLGLPTSALATDASTKTTDTITVLNVTEASAVTAYKIVQTDAAGNGFETVDGVTIADLKAPTADEVQQIASDILSGKITPASTTMTKGDKGTYTAADMAPGMYLVLATGAGPTVYNPMIVSVGYNDKGQAAGGQVDSKDSYTINGTTAYAKSTTPTPDKEIVNSSRNANGDDVNIGDAVSFKITSAVPSYSKEYFNDKGPVYTLTDSVQGGLENITNIKVYKGTAAEGNELDAKYYSVSGQGSTSLTVELTKDGIKAMGGQDLVVTYDCTLGANANVNFNPNDNTATLTYSNNPNGGTHAESDTTHHYTFEINGQVSGWEGYQDQNREVVKVVNADGTTSTVETSTVSDEKVGEATPLEGAEFTLYSDAECKTPVKGADGKDMVARSDATGRLIGFKGLDAGNYWFKETKAPTGYAKNETAHSVVISATFNEDGTLANYTVKVDDASSTYTATYQKNDQGQTTGTVTKTEGNTTDVIGNNNIGTLPSTGGVGTLIFTLMGAAFVALAAGLLYRMKKNLAQ